MEVLETAGLHCLGMFLVWNTTYLALISSSTYVPSAPSNIHILNDIQTRRAPIRRYHNDIPSFLSPSFDLKHTSFANCIISNNGISVLTPALLQRHSSPRRLQPPSSALLILNIAVSDISTATALWPSRQNSAAPAIWPRQQQHLSNHRPNSCHGIPLRLPNSSSCSCSCFSCSCCCCRRLCYLADCSQLGAAARAGRRRRELTGNLRKAQKRDGAEWMVILNVDDGTRG
jgi:hypothetical protein